MTRENKILLYVVVGIVMVIYSLHHSGSTESGGTSVCEKEYASDPAPVETHDQFMQHCVSDFNNYGK